MKTEMGGALVRSLGLCFMDKSKWDIIHVLKGASSDPLVFQHPHPHPDVCLRNADVLCTEQKQGLGVLAGDEPTPSIALGATARKAVLGLENKVMADWLLFQSPWQQDGIRRFLPLPAPPPSSCQLRNAFSPK